MRRCAAAIARAVVAFLNAVLVDCFLFCFRPRPRPGSHSGSSCRDALVPSYQEGEVLSDDEQGLVSTGRLYVGLDDGGSFDDETEEVRREANYLKLCGTISETPAELQNECCEINLETTDTDQCNNMTTGAQETNSTLVSEANSSEDSINDEQTKNYILSSDLNIGDTHDLPGVESVPSSAFREKTPFLNTKQKMEDRTISPFPTPSLISDEMQTPGTIYTSHRGAHVFGKCVRTRKQFIYPVLRTIEDKIQHVELPEDTLPFPLHSPPKLRNTGADSITKPKQTPSKSVANPGFFKSPSFSLLDDKSYQEREAQFKCHIDNAEQLDEGALAKSNTNEKHAALSLSHWLKPSVDKENQGDVQRAEGKQSYDETERPVFMTSDLNCDVENPTTPRLPTIWDGNGIPNTNTRYKEDKRVTWRATPFEERLLKVLSDKEVCPARVGHRKLFNP